MLKIIHLSAKTGLFEIKEVKDLNQAIRLVGIKGDENWESATLNDGEEPFQGVGILMRDQDKRLKKNLLGHKGDIVFLQMDRQQDANGILYRFDSLNDVQIKDIKKALRWMMLAQSVNQDWGAEV